MSAITKLQVRRNGALTLPAVLRRKYGIEVGDVVTLIDLGDGSILLTPIVTQVDRLADRITKAVAEAGVTEDEIFAALDEERERFYAERYDQG